MKKIFIASLIIFIFSANSLQAKILYVDQSRGNDSITYANNNESNPWATIGRAAWGSTSYSSPNAAQAAAAGDTVLITAGTYITDGNPSGRRWDVALNPANNGTLGNPITFRGVGTVTILLASGSSGPTIGANSRNYIVWDNIHIDDSVAEGLSQPDTGPVVFHVSTGSKIINCVIKGKYATWSDNYCGVRLEATDGLTVSDNEIYDITGNWGHNEAGIMAYDTANSVIEHNYIHDSNCGMYIKGDHDADGWPQEDNTIRLNWVEDCPTKGLFFIAGHGSQVYQNIVKGCGYGIKIDPVNSHCGADITVANNTFISTNIPSDIGFCISTGYIYLANFRGFNNIYYGSFYEAVNMGTNSGIGDANYEHNLYYGFDDFGSIDSAQISFARWRATYGQDHVTPDGLNANPLFVDTTYYKLQAGSPALTLGIDILNLSGRGTSTIIPAGAYITGDEVIGRTGGGSISPRAPTGLRIE